MDARIVLSDVQEETKRKRLSAWLESAGRFLRLKEGRASVGLNGVVFEVRQGYKSKDAKRQNADISNGAAAYAHGYLPVVMILSNQIDLDVADRYLRAKLLVLRGTNGGSDRDSTYVFCRNVLNYDLAGFFRRNAPALKTEVRRVLEGLLR